MLIPAGADFSADRVVELALRQDVGIDSSKMAMRQKLKYVDDSPMQPIWEYKKKYRDRDPVVRSEDHLASYNFVSKQERQQAFELEKPATFINRPLTRSQLRKKFMRSVTKEDVDWRNAVLVTKFLNETGKLYNRYQSRLPTNVHRKVAKTVKKMRNLGLLPYVGLLKPTDKIPLGSFIEDVEEMHKKTIDPVSGRLFLRHTLQDDARDKAIRAAKKFDENTQKSDYPTAESEEQAEVRN